MQYITILYEVIGMTGIIIKRTVLGFYNIYCDRQLLATVDLAQAQKIAPTITENVAVAYYEVNMKQVKTVTGAK